MFVAALLANVKHQEVLDYILATSSVVNSMRPSRLRPEGLVAFDPQPLTFDSFRKKAHDDSRRFDTQAYQRALHTLDRLLTQHKIDYAKKADLNFCEFPGCERNPSESELFAVKCPNCHGVTYCNSTHCAVDAPRHADEDVCKVRTCDSLLFDLLFLSLLRTVPLFATV